MRKYAWFIPALVIFLTFCCGELFAQGRSVGSAAPEKVKNGVSAAAQAARQAALFSALSAQTPPAVSNAPVTVQLSKNEKELLAKPKPRSGQPLRRWAKTAVHRVW